MPLRPPLTRALAGCALILSVGLSPAARAESLKGIMRRMGETTKTGKAVLGSSDAAASAAVMKAYAEEARTAAALFAGGSTKEKDFRDRFAKLAATADGAASGLGFKPAFGAVVSQCRSCHSAYK